MTDEAGRFPAELEITKDSVVIGTANFIMWGEANPHPEGTTDGQQGTIIPELTLLVERVEAAASSVLDMEVVANTLPAGSQATYSYDEDLNKATFGIPQGEAGAGAAGVVASAYSASATYKVGDYVIHNSNLYRCTTAITTAEAFTAAHWTQIVLADDVSDLKTDLKTFAPNGLINVIGEKTITWKNGYIGTGGLINASTASKFAVINLNAGETVVVGTRNTNICIIGSTTENDVSVGDTITPIKITTGINQFETYEYTATENMNVVVCVLWSEHILNITKKSETKIELENYESKIDAGFGSVWGKYDNLFDGYLMVGSISNDTGEFDPADTDYLCTDFIPVKKGQYYYDIFQAYALNGKRGFSKIARYDGEKNFINALNYGRPLTDTYNDNTSIDNTANNYFYASEDGYFRWQADRALFTLDRACIIESDVRFSKMGNMPPYSENLNVNHKELKQFMKDTKNLLEYPEYIAKDYAITEANSVLGTLQSLQSANPKGLSFGFITDLHFNSSNELATIATDIGNAMQCFNRKAFVPMYFFGGDNVSEQSTRSGALNNMRYLAKIINSFKTPKGYVKGNHDDSSISGWDSSVGKYRVGYNVFDNEQYYIFYKDNENIFNIGMNKDRERLFYYVDFPSQQIRVICLNCVDIPYEDDGSGYLKYDGQHQYGYSNEQLNWVINSALKFDHVKNADEWSVVTIQHIRDFSATSPFAGEYVQADHNGEVMFNIFKAFKEKTSYSFRRTNSDFDCDVSCDFTNAEQDLICRISGHTHADRHVIYDGILFISTMQAGTNAVGNEVATDGNTYAKVSGTADETAFDIFTIDKDSKKIYATRYGVGVDREFDY